MNVDKRLCLFTCNSYEEMEGIIDNKKDKKILDTLRKLSVDNAFLFDYDYEAVKRNTEKSLREEGREKGIKEKTINIARNMLSQGFDVQMISQITKLSIDDIKKLKYKCRYYLTFFLFFY